MVPLDSVILRFCAFGQDSRPGRGTLEEHGQTLASSHLTGRWNQYITLKKKSKVGSLALWVFNWGVRLGHFSSEANNSCLKFRQSLLKEPLHEIRVSFGSWRKACDCVSFIVHLLVSSKMPDSVVLTKNGLQCEWPGWCFKNVKKQ